MGIFSNKQQTDQPFSADNSQDAAQPTSSSTDVPQPTDFAASSISPFPGQGAPPIDDQSSNDAGDYIVADPPVHSSPAAPPTPQISEYSNEYDEPQPVATPAAEPATEPVAESNEESIVTIATPSEDEPAETDLGTPIGVHTTPSVNNISDNGSHDDLAAIKQEALKQLSPLVPHLDQSPEDKFHTTMMMLQATDDPSLVKPAYEAAQTITDNKTRAQALLDIVNEINYFTNQKSNI